MEPGARRAGPDGALHVDDGLDALELELDQLDRVRRERFGLRDRDRDRLPGVHDLLAGERILDRPEPVATIGRSSAASTATTPGSSRAAVMSIDLINAWASWASRRRACRSPLTGMSAAKRVLPRTFGSESRRGVETPIAD